MEYITDIKKDITDFIGSLGYAIIPNDFFLLNESIEKVRSYIKNKSNQNEVPEGLKYVWMNRSASEFLNFKIKLNQLNIESLNFKRIEKEISEGDTKVVFDNTLTTGDKFEGFLTFLQTYGEDEILKYRRLVW